MSRYTYIKVARQDVMAHGVDVALVLAFTRFRREVKSDWVPSRRVIMDEFKLTQGRADKAVKAVCQMLSLRHKRTPKATEIKPPRKGKAFQKTQLCGEPVNHICGEPVHQSCGEPVHQISGGMWLDGAPPNITSNELPKEAANLPYPLLDGPPYMRMCLTNYCNQGIWFWMTTNIDGNLYLWDSNNMPPIDARQELKCVGKEYCPIDTARVMVGEFADNTPDHFKKHIQALTNH